MKAGRPIIDSLFSKVPPMMKFAKLGRASTFFAASLIALSIVQPASAAIFFKIGGADYSGTAGAIPFGTVEVTIATVAVGEVEVVINFKSTGVNSGAKLDGLLLNVTNSDINTNAPVVSKGSDPGGLIDGGVSFQASDTSNQQSADGSFGWDVKINFLANGAGSIDPGETYSFTLVGTGLTEASFLEKNSWNDSGSPGKTGSTHEFATVHIHEVQVGKSGWYANQNPDPTVDIITLPNVPEPTSLAVWGLGLIAAGFGARRRRKRS